jgi:hypothetical protein
LLHGENLAPFSGSKGVSLFGDSPPAYGDGSADKTLKVWDISSLHTSK